VSVALLLLAGALALQDTPPRERGLSVSWYAIGEPMERVLLLVPGQTPNVARRVEVLDLDGEDLPEFPGPFLTQAEGWLVVPEPGTWGLRLTSDDGSKLWIDGQLVIDHDGLHSETALAADLELEAGAHPLELWHFECYGGWMLRLEWRRPGSKEFELVPADALACEAGLVRVTAPGKKRAVRPLERGRPGDGMPLVALHPALDHAVIRPEGFEPRVGGIAWLPDGRMLVATWDALGAVYLLEGAETGQREKVRVSRFAAGLAEPLGLSVLDGRVFVVQKQELTELIDRDGDGTCDEYRAVSTDWQVTPNFHEFSFGLEAFEGRLHFNLAIAINPGGRSTWPQVPGRGSVLAVHPDTGATEIVAHGLRTPNGIGPGPGGALYVTDNQGDWLPSSKIVRLERGAFYGSRAVLGEAAKDLAVTPPVLWLPQNEIGNSPGSCDLIPAGWGPYSGQLAHGDVTHGGVKRSLIEEFDGVLQGCVLRWTQGLEAGVNRVRFGPDGALYVGGIGSSGNWGQQGKLKHGLERLAFNGRLPFDLVAVRAKSDGFELELTRPLAAGLGWESENWLVEDWRYLPTADYGGPKLDERRLTVRSASVSEDRLRVFLEVEGLQAGRVVHVRAAGPLVDERGERLWTTEAWYTLNAIPRDRPGERRAPPPPRPQNVLSADERAAGFELLFDGKTSAGWSNFRSSGPVRGWEVQGGALVRTGAGGDLVTQGTYADFELRLDWRIAPGGNSGIFFHVGDEGGSVWETAPEMQVLDNDGHPDGRQPMHSAGANYGLIAPERDLSRPVGMWNEARLVVRGAHVEHWLNGEKLLEYELWSPEWEALVAGSKFRALERYGRLREGRIALQDHGDRVEYRNLRIRRL
jgi:cytochrome c